MHGCSDGDARQLHAPISCAALQTCCPQALEAACSLTLSSVPQMVALCGGTAAPLLSPSFYAALSFPATPGASVLVPARVESLARLDAASGELLPLNVSTDLRPPALGAANCSGVSQGRTPAAAGLHTPAPLPALTQARHHACHCRSWWLAATFCSASPPTLTAAQAASRPRHWRWWSATQHCRRVARRWCCAPPSASAGPTRPRQRGRCGCVHGGNVLAAHARMQLLQHIAAGMSAACVLC